MKTKIIYDENIKYFREFIWCLEKINVFNVKFQSGNHEIIFQPEQMTYPPYLNRLLNNTINTKIILDYSVHNQTILSNYNKRVIVCPIFFIEEFLFPPCNIEYDFVMLGYFSDRRKKIYNELSERGYKVLNITDEYDMYKKYKLILSAKCLLNIHSYEGDSIFEFSRCSVPVYNNMNVISESSNIKDDKKNLTNEYVLEHVLFCDYKDMVDIAIKNIDRKINVDYSYLKKISRYEIQRINRELNDN